ncbi:MAG: dihydroorotase [Candidatus Omnitrophica bacterium]|nr:dihydroorotase [Candidatus Omnitrophota bacterium]
MSILIKNVKVVGSPGISEKDKLSVLIENGIIAEIAKSVSAKAKESIDGEGLFLIPGLVDLHAHFREPGFENKETVETGAHAALHGGYVACMTMPNTNPPCDNASVVQNILEKASKIPFYLFPCGTISKQREGKELAEMAELKRAGCRAVSDDGDYVEDALLTRHAMEYVSMLDLLYISHAEDRALSRNGVMNEGKVSTRLGLRGIPNMAEAVAVARDLTLAEFTGARLHIAHVSTREAVSLIRAAKRKGVKVTAEVTPHHLIFTDEALTAYDTNFKVNPPLRQEEDIKSLREGLLDGTIDCIATDHAPHREEEKDLDFEEAPFGTTGLETAFSAVLTELYHKRKALSLADIVRLMSRRPAELLGAAEFGLIKKGIEANVALVDLAKEWTVKKDYFQSRSKNSCFIGQNLKGQVVLTISKGKVWKFV